MISAQGTTPLVPRAGRGPTRAGAPPLLGRRERNKEEKRQRITAAARALFSAKGFAATTTQEIAQRAEIGTGTLFLYVQSKEEVLVLVFREDMDRVCDRAFASRSRRASLLDQLLHVYGALIRFHGEDQRLARVFVKEVMFVSERLRRSVAEFVDGLQRRCITVIEAAQQRGELAADVPAAGLAENLFAAYLLLLQKWLGLGGPLATAEHIARLRQSFALQLRGLLPGKASRRARARRQGSHARR